MTPQEKYRKKNKEKLNIQNKEYNNRPESKEKLKLRKSTLEYKERNKAWMREYRKKDSVKTRNQEDKLKRRYGISIEKYNDMYLSQEGRCAICRRHQSELAKKLAVDHNHTTGIVRSLLCMSCNTGIGKFKDSIELIEIALKYLKHHDKTKD